MLEFSSQFSNPLISHFLEITPTNPLSATPAHASMMPELPHLTGLRYLSIGTQAAPLAEGGAFTTTPPTIAPDVQQALQTFFSQPDWHSQLSGEISSSFQSFQGYWLSTSIVHGNFALLPSIQVVPADTLGDKSVSFDWLTGTISLSSEFMAQNTSNPAAIVNTILEAISAQKGYSSGNDRPSGEGNTWFSPVRGWGSSHWRPFNSFNSVAGSDGDGSGSSWGMHPFRSEVWSMGSVFLGQSSTNPTTLNAAQQVVQSFFSQPNWASQLPMALWNQSSLWMMPYQFAMGNFQNFPTLQVMTGNELDGQALAYDANTNSIQVSNWFLEANQDESSVVVKEILNLNFHIQRGTLKYYAAPTGSDTLILDTVIADAQAQLVAFVSQPDWIEKVKPAFGDDLSVNGANVVAQLITNGSFQFDELVRVVPATTLNGANSAYDLNSNIFYLSEEFIRANAGQAKIIASALIEEFGHFLDIQVNPQDSPGDEGKIFAAIVQGTLLSAVDWDGLLAVDDSLPPVIDMFKPLLEPAFANAQATLNTLFAKPDWVDQLLPTFGNEVDLNIAAMVAQSVLSGQLQLQSLVKVIPAQSMAGLESIFDASTNTIYLSEEFVTRNSAQPNVVTRVLLEAFGHYLDTQINVTDAQGDEGQMFAAIAQGTLLSAADWYAMKREDDYTTVTLNGQAQWVEVAA